jgi:hypothetical protein
VSGDRVEEIALAVGTQQCLGRMLSVYVEQALPTSRNKVAVAGWP